MFALVLAAFGFFLSVWILVPGPVLPLFILGVGGTELWPILAALNLFAFALCIRGAGWRRFVAGALALAAFGCTLVPPSVYAIRGPYIPASAFFDPWPVHPRAASAQTSRPTVLTIYGGAWQRGSPLNDALLNATIASWGYRVIALDYPHAPQSHWPAQREAILRQIDNLRGVRVVLLGHSSGAQLAMIAGAMRSRRTAGIITYASPVDLAMGYLYPSQPDIINARKIMSDLCGGPPALRPEC